MKQRRERSDEGGERQESDRTVTQLVGRPLVMAQWGDIDKEENVEFLST